MNDHQEILKKNKDQDYRKINKSYKSFLLNFLITLCQFIIN